MKFLVEGCGAWDSTRTNLRIHFVHLYAQDKIVIMEERKRPHTCCTACDMFMPWEDMKNRHPTIALCTWGSSSKKQHLAEEEERKGAAMAL